MINSDCFFLNYHEEAKEAKAHATRDRVPHDEIRINEIKAHKEKETRWRREIKRPVSRHEFYMMMDVSHRSKQPLDHLLNFFQGQCDRHLFTLVTSKATEIATEFETILQDAHWQDVCSWETLSLCVMIMQKCCKAKRSKIASTVLTRCAQASFHAVLQQCKSSTCAGS